MNKVLTFLIQNFIVFDNLKEQCLYFLSKLRKCVVYNYKYWPGVIMQIVPLISIHLSVFMYFVGSNVSFYLDTGDGTTYNMSNSFNDNIFNSSNYTVFGLYTFTSYVCGVF